MAHVSSTVAWIQDTIRNSLHLDEFIFTKNCRVFIPDHTPPPDGVSNAIEFVCRPESTTTTEDALAYFYNTGIATDTFDVIIIEDPNNCCLQLRVMPQVLVVGKSMGFLIVVGENEPSTWLRDNLIKVAHHRDGKNRRCLTVFLITDGGREQTKLAADLVFTQQHQ